MKDIFYNWLIRNDIPNFRIMDFILNKNSIDVKIQQVNKSLIMMLLGY